MSCFFVAMYPKKVVGACFAGYILEFYVDKSPDERYNLKGSLETLNTMQLTEDMRGLDAQSKVLLHSREVLAVILQGTVEEYQGYSRREIMDFIEMDTLEERKEVSEGRTNARIRGENPEFLSLNEKTSYFDVAFRAKAPEVSGKDVLKVSQSAGL